MQACAEGNDGNGGTTDTVGPVEPMPPPPPPPPPSEYTLTERISGDGDLVGGCPSGSCDFNEGERVALEAEPARGYAFVSLSCNPSNACIISGDSVEVTLNSDVTVSATFEPIPVTLRFFDKYGSLEHEATYRYGEVIDIDSGGGDFVEWRVLKGNTPRNSRSSQTEIILTEDTDLEIYRFRSCDMSSVRRVRLFDEESGGSSQAFLYVEFDLECDTIELPEYKIYKDGTFSDTLVDTIGGQTVIGDRFVPSNNPIRQDSPPPSNAVAKSSEFRVGPAENACGGFLNLRGNLRGYVVANGARVHQGFIRDCS